MKKALCLIPLFCLGSENVVAGTMGAVQESSNYFLTISAGPAWTSNHKSQIINLEPDLIKAYVAQKKDSTIGSGELFVGWQSVFNQYFSYQIGPAFSLSSSADLAGSIWDEADPIFDNFFYRYRINHKHLTAKAKLLAAEIFMVQPYISGSLGVGFNRSYDFSSSSKTLEQLPFPGFISRNRTSFSYTVGLGVEKAIGSHLSGGIGYEFADWGKSNLARTPLQTIGTGLRLNHLYTHQLQFSLSIKI